MKPQRAIILAAGLGSRLGPKGSQTPKCLTPINGIPILKRALRALERAGITEACIVTGHRGEVLEEYFSKNPSSLKITFCSNHDYATTNNGVSLGLALKDDSQSFVLLDGDLVFDQKILEDLLNHPGENAVVVDNNKARLREESMKALQDKDDKISLLSKQISISQSAGEYIGLLKLNSTWARAFVSWCSELTEEQRATYYYEHGLNDLMKKNGKLDWVPTQGAPWVEVDMPEDILLAEKLFPTSPQFPHG